MKTWTKTIIGIGLVAGLAAPAFAFADGGGRCDRGMHSERHMDRMAKELNLSDEQQKKIRNIHDKERDQFKSLGERMRDNHRALRQLDPLDSHYTAAVKKLASEQGKLIEKMIVLHSHERTQVYRVLTPEQRKEAAKMKDERYDRMQDRKRDGGMGNGPHGGHRQGPDNVM